MKHPIDPKVDCVFKALLGSEENRNLLIHFLNAVLINELVAPVAEVEILNPYNAKEFLSDKLSIVDVKAKDGDGRLFQVEIQLLNYRNLPARMAHNWADLYSKQLKSGQDYRLLNPVYGIWLLGKNLLPNDPAYAHHFKLRDDRGRVLIEHGGIWLLELEKFTAERIETEEQRWIKLFKEGEELDDSDLPDWMNTDEMRQAMQTLKLFSEKERDYHAYQARQNFLREQSCIEAERQEALQALQQANRELERSEREREQAEQRRAQAEQERESALRERNATLAEVERLRALLEQRQN